MFSVYTRKFDYLLQITQIDATRRLLYLFHSSSIASSGTSFYNQGEPGWGHKLLDEGYINDRGRISSNPLGLVLVVFFCFL